MAEPTTYRVRFLSGRIGINTDVPDLTIEPGQDFELTLRSYIAEHLTAALTDVELDGHPDELLRNAYVTNGENRRAHVASFQITAIPAPTS